MRALPLALVLAAPLVAGTAAAQAIPCGEPYAVRRGDTLMRIARRAYGGDHGLATLLEANAALFARRDPSLIEVGEVLAVPCPGDPTPVEAAAEAAAAAPEQFPETAPVTDPPADLAVEAAPAPTAEPARNIEAAPEAPETAAATAEPEPVAAATPAVEATVEAEPAAAALETAEAPAAPLQTDVLATAPEPDAGAGDAPVAVAEAAPAPAAEAEAAPAPDAAAATLARWRIEGPLAIAAQALAQKAVGARGGLALPLARPDCAAGTEDARCAAVWSDPIMETALVTLARAGAAPVDPAAARVCHGPASPDAPAPVAAAACVDALLEGTADLATMAASAADAALAALGPAAAEIVELPAFTRRIAMRAAAPADDAEAVAAVAALDEGLARLRDSGAWLDAVQAALSAR